MKHLLASLVFVLLSLGFVQAQDAPSTAWSGLVQEQKSLKDAIILGAQLTESAEGQVWEFQILDSNYKNDRRILRWSGGKLSADSSGRLRAFGSDTLIPLSSTNLSSSVGPVRTNVKQLLANSAKKPNSIQYALSRKSAEETPVWNVYCLDAQQVRIAEMTYDAGSNQLLAVELKPVDSKVDTVKKEAASTGRTVEKTFKGIGADLEEFFTGKRSVDK